VRWPNIGAVRGPAHHVGPAKSWPAVVLHGPGLTVKRHRRREGPLLFHLIDPLGGHQRPKIGGARAPASSRYDAEGWRRADAAARRVVSLGGLLYRKAHSWTDVLARPERVRQFDGAEVQDVLSNRVVDDEDHSGPSQTLMAATRRQTTR
jgi:hypothetical protein